MSAGPGESEVLCVMHAFFPQEPSPAAGGRRWLAGTSRSGGSEPDTKRRREGKRGRAACDSMGKGMGIGMEPSPASPPARDGDACEEEGCSPTAEESEVQHQSRHPSQPSQRAQPSPAQPNPSCRVAWTRTQPKSGGCEQPDRPVSRSLGPPGCRIATPPPTWRAGVRMQHVADLVCLPAGWLAGRSLVSYQGDDGWVLLDHGCSKVPTPRSDLVPDPTQTHTSNVSGLWSLLPFLLLAARPRFPSNNGPDHGKVSCARSPRSALPFSLVRSGNFPCRQYYAETDAGNQRASIPCNLGEGSATIGGRGGRRSNPLIFCRGLAGRAPTHWGPGTYLPKL